MTFDDLFNMDRDALRAVCAERVGRPGKFEGCPIFAPYFYEAVLDGGGDYSFYDDREREHDVFVLTSHDRCAFDELEDVYAVVCFEGDDGFFYCESFATQEDLDTHVADIEADAYDGT